MTTILTLASGDMGRVWQKAAKTWYPYAEKHDYYLKTYSWLLDDTLAPSWNKVIAMLNNLDCATGPIWWVDSDMTVFDPSVALESIIPKEHKDIWFSQDWNGLCGCMFRCVPSKWTKDFLKAVLVLGDVKDPDQFGKGLGCKWEQNAFKTLARDFPSVGQHIGYLSPELVSDKQPSNAPFWHYGARSNDVRIRMMGQLQHL